MYFLYIDFPHNNTLIGINLFFNDVCSSYELLYNFIIFILEFNSFSKLPFPYIQNIVISYFSCSLFAISTNTLSAPP